MIRELLEMYSEGAITGYQLMLDCLHKINPDEPDLVLSQLPDEVLEEILEYSRRYDPRRPRPSSPIPPTMDQVRSAEVWIQNLRLDRTNPVNL